MQPPAERAAPPNSRGSGTGGIPVSFTPGVTAQSVECVWQALKVSRARTSTRRLPRCSSATGRADHRAPGGDSRPLFVLVVAHVADRWP
ncbi:DUF6939 family protein [Actinosynnema sp. CA-299493]